MSEAHQSQGCPGHANVPPAEFPCPKCGTVQHAVAWTYCGSPLSSYVCVKCWLFVQIDAREATSPDLTRAAMLAEHQRRKGKRRGIV